MQTNWLHGVTNNMAQQPFDVKSMLLYCLRNLTRLGPVDIPQRHPQVLLDLGHQS